jgi:hypothetical protein
MMRERRLLKVLFLAVALSASSKAIQAQGGRWEASAGLFGNVVDTAATTGHMLDFTRWPGEEKWLQHGLRIGYLRGRQHLVNYPPAPGSTFNVTDEHQMWLLQAGMPFRISTTGGPIRPFLDVEPAGLMYRSLDLTRYTQPFPHKIGIVDRSKWLWAPSLSFSAGLQTPAISSFRVQVRGDYRLGWLYGRAAEGANAKGVWKAWTFTAGGSFGY